jgi:hypothetical protein
LAATFKVIERRWPQNRQAAQGWMPPYLGIQANKTTPHLHHTRLSAGDDDMKKPPDKCSHKWEIGMQDFRKYPEVEARYICLKCKKHKTEFYGTKELFNVI